MIHHPVYEGADGVSAAVVSWLLATLPTGRGRLEFEASSPASLGGLIVAVTETGCVVWDAATAQPLAAIDASAEAWLSDEVVDDPAIDEALASRGYRRGGMRVTRRVVSPFGGGFAAFRATQWTSAAVRAAAGESGAVWK